MDNAHICYGFISYFYLSDRSKQPKDAYTTNTELGTAISTISYAYDNDWVDQLTSYNGDVIRYDEIGNPESYRGWAFDWSGRNLTGASKGEDSITYTYNSDGLRTTKTVNGMITTYTYQGSLLMAEQSTGKNLYFSYDTTGKAVSVNYNGTEYYYLRNGQGDIVGLLDQSGTKVVSYVYDSWGKLIETTGTLAGTLGVDNPLRYRGYYFDQETTYYCLSSRYYDPEVGRFISADALLSTGQGVLGYNMYAYCLNDPVNRYDSSGCISGLVEDRWVHDQVLQDICKNHKELRWKNTYIVYNNGKFGYCDLYSTTTGEVWELKKNSNSWSCRHKNAVGQLERYTNGTLIANKKLDLIQGGTITQIASSKTTIFKSEGVWDYTITYWYESEGILRYEYYKTLNKQRALESVKTAAKVTLVASIAGAAYLALGPAGAAATFTLLQ